MKFAVVQFPGSNCDQDCLAALRGIEGIESDFVWHKETSLRGWDAIVLPGGFSYGDYLRCGAIARFSPIMRAVVEDARAGKLVIGICNGFQILCEGGLLPGALIRNRSLHFVCDMVTTRVEVAETPFTRGIAVGTLLRIPVAHGDGCYYADETTLQDLNAHDQVLMRYCDSQGRITAAANPNGSIENIAGICNGQRNVFGLMPHPDRACEERLGSSDGARIFESMLQTLTSGRVAA
jgi:phosphoribosylformylglycinamidine synthase